MAIDLRTIDERLAKAKEEAAFWENARAILADPRLKDIAHEDIKPGNTVIGSTFAAASVAGGYGELRKSVLEVLPDCDASITARLTTQQIVDRLLAKGFVFVSANPTIAVNGALVALERKEEAESVGKLGNAKLWRKKRQKTQEAPEGAP